MAFYINLFKAQKKRFFAIFFSPELHQSLYPIQDSKPESVDQITDQIHKIHDRIHMWVMRFLRCLVAYKPSLKTPDGSAEAIKIRGSLSDLFSLCSSWMIFVGQHPHKKHSFAVVETPHATFSLKESFLKSLLD